MSINFFMKMAFKSLIYRRGSILLSIIAITVSVFVLLGIEHIKKSAKESFNGTISGIDLIVGPRTSDLNLLLTTVFRLGAASHNMSWESYESLKANKNVAWTIPIALGDSHRGYRVVGTETLFFDHYRYGQSRTIEFMVGRPFSQTFEVVLGAHVAESLSYNLEKKLVLSHGIAEASFQKHDAFPFSVVGILKPTGTPIDNALYVSLAGLEAIHDNRVDLATSENVNIHPESISAAFVGLKTKLATFKVQRHIRSEIEEPLSAILPGVALTQLWQITRGLENTLQLISSLVLFASLLGLSAVLLATVRERKTELKILRTLGAGPLTVFTLVQIEALGMTIIGIFVAVAGISFTLFLASDWVMYEYGIDLSVNSISKESLLLFAYVLLGATVVGSLPAFQSYRELKNI